MELKYHKIKLALLIIGVIILYSISIDYIEGRSFCVFYNLTNIECFGCGLTRAFFNFTRFNFSTALNYNKLILFFGPTIILSYLFEIFTSIKYIINQKNSPKGLLEHIFYFIF